MQLRPECRDCHRLRPRARAIVVVLDGDGQNDPADLPLLLQALDGADAAVGVRTAPARRLGAQGLVGSATATAT
ncbi:MAG: hypothetical protein U1E76_27990 [Planctomycetota bacterium]